MFPLPAIALHPVVPLKGDLTPIKSYEILAQLSCLSFQFKVQNVKATNLNVKMVIALLVDGAAMVFRIVAMDPMK